MSSCKTCTQAENKLFTVLKSTENKDAVNISKLYVPQLCAEHDTFCNQLSLGMFLYSKHNYIGCVDIFLGVAQFPYIPRTLCGYFHVF